MTGASVLLAAAAGVGVANGQQQGTQPPDVDCSEPEAVQSVETVEPADVARGDTVTFTGRCLPKFPQDILVYLNGAAAGTASRVSNDRHSFVYQISADPKQETDPRKTLGRFSVRLEFKEPTAGSAAAVSGEGPKYFPKVSTELVLTVHKESGKEKVVVSAVNAVPGHPLSFTVLGSGFSSTGEDNKLLVDEHGEPDPRPKWVGGTGCEGLKDGVFHGCVQSEHQLEFCNLPAAYRGLTTVQIRVGTETSDPAKVTLARVGQAVPLWVAGGGLVVLVLLVYVVTRRGSSASGVADSIAGKRYGFLTALLLDKETDTFSLSRFQFYAWTAAAIVGYLYLAVSRMLVQWNFIFVDVPSGLPGIVMISASTTFLAQGIQSAKGPKGAGGVQPGWSDLIATGGVVAPERFQFFVWTILGIGVFLTLSLLQDPAKISDLPSVPPQFMALMGVSSVGYLGGKMARKAGPVIDEILAERGSLKLTLKGRNLSQDASFRIGTDDLSSDCLDCHKPALVTKDDQSDDPNMAKVLALSIPTPKPAWYKSELTIINPDGQKATWPYSVKTVLGIDPPQVKGGQEQSLTVSGQNFDAKATAAVTRGADSLQSSIVPPVTPEKLVVKLTPPAPVDPASSYVATLEVTNPDNTKASGTFTVTS